MCRHRIRCSYTRSRHIPSLQPCTGRDWCWWMCTHNSGPHSSRCIFAYSNFLSEATPLSGKKYINRCVTGCHMLLRANLMRSALQVAPLSSRIPFELISNVCFGFWWAWCPVRLYCTKGLFLVGFHSLGSSWKVVMRTQFCSDKLELESATSRSSIATNSIWSSLWSHCPALRLFGAQPWRSWLFSYRTWAVVRFYPIFLAIRRCMEADLRGERRCSQVFGIYRRC